MNILMIVLAVFCAYVLFVAASWVLIRLIFPKIEVHDTLEEKPFVAKSRVVRREVSRSFRRQKNLAF